MSDNQSSAPTNTPLRTLSSAPTDTPTNTPVNPPQKTPPATSYLSATGKITYNFTNDYMFRAILQRNVIVLKGLICSLLHLRPEHITEITITNPIELGKTIDNKEFILDINVTLNNHTRINLEMQVANELNWADRSLSYLCRTFDQLYSGEAYTQALPVIHIGFLDFQLFSDDAEFYATYKLLNVKNHKVFSDKLTLGVVDLTHIELATEEDKSFQIDRWAKLFKATTWEEIKLMAEGNEYLMQATQELYECNADELIRQQCRAREEYYKYQRTIDKALKDTTAERDRLAAEKAEALETIQKQQNALKEKDDALQAQADEILRLQALLAEKKSSI